MSTAERLLTADEFACIDEPDEGGKLELDEGMLVHHMPVNADHGGLQVLISGALNEFVRARDLGRVYVETAYRLTVPGAAGDVVRSPDVSFASRIPTREERRQPTLPFEPELAIEVTSPSDRDGEVQRKVQQYLASGVKRVWVVRPENASVTVHHPGGEAHIYSAGDALGSGDAGFDEEGFELPLANLFDDE